MGQEREAKFYNEGPNSQMVNYEKYQSHKRPRICMAADHLPPPNECSTIVEFGCSYGLFALEIKERGYKDYLGIDFAANPVAKAKEIIPEYQFIVADLRNEATYELFKNHKIFVALEMLEHIKKDIELLRAITPGSLIIFSVPSGDSAGHVRYYPEMLDVIIRYHDFLCFLEVVQIPSNGIFVCKTIRREA